MRVLEGLDNDVRRSTHLYETERRINLLARHETRLEIEVGGGVVDPQLRWGTSCIAKILEAQEVGTEEGQGIQCPAIAHVIRDLRRAVVPDEDLCNDSI